MPASIYLPASEGSSLSGVDRRALIRLLEQSLDQGFRLAIVEAATQADRDSILAEVAPTVGPRLLRAAVDELPGADTNLWMALRAPFAAYEPRCLALWGFDAHSGSEWARQLNVQRDLFVSDFAVPWLLFIHPASRVALLQIAPDFCDFALLWLRDDSQPRIPSTPMALESQSSSLGSSNAIDHDPLLQQARAALEEARFDAARDALSRFDLQSDHDILDHVRRQLYGARLERELGHPALAEALLRDARNTLERQPSTVETQALARLADAEYAGILSRSGRYGEAETLLRKLLARVEEALGREHPEYSVCAISLAGVLDGQGKYIEAERMARDATAILAKTRARDPTYGASLNVLATVLSAQGKYIEAERTLRDSLHVKSMALGSEHPSYGSSLHNLAHVLAAQGKYAEAEAILRDALALREKVLGRQHPDYCGSLQSLALLLSKQGRDSEAEPLLRTSVALLERALGREHPVYSTSLHNLATILSGRGKDAEAEPILREVLALKAKVQGPDHPDYGASLHALAGSLSNQGKYGEAERARRESLSIAEKALGHDHPHLYPTLASLAVDVAHQGRTREAIRLLERALSVGRAALGAGHPEVHQMQDMLKQFQRHRRHYR